VWGVQREADGTVSVAGVVRNPYLYPIRAVRLHVTALGSDGALAGETFVDVPAEIAPGHGVSFTAPLPAAGATYGVTVHAFEFAPRVES
jgi:hypothetical protein